MENEITLADKIVLSLLPTFVKPKDNGYGGEIYPDKQDIEGQIKYLYKIANLMVKEREIVKYSILTTWG